MSSEPRTIVLRDPEESAPGARLGRRAALGVCLCAGLAALARAALDRGSVAGVLGPAERRAAEDVFSRALDASRALDEGKLSPVAWQDVVEAVFRGASAEDVARSIGIDALVARAPEVSLGAAVVPFTPVSPDGPRLPSFVTKLFVLRAGRANPPHAHNNMVSMHFVLRGRFRVRHYERVRDEPQGIVLRPTIDRVLGPGEATSISDARDNVHWHLAETDGVLLDVLCAGLFDRPTDTHLVDPIRAEALDGGLLRAPRVSTVGEALELYG